VIKRFMQKYIYGEAGCASPFDYRGIGKSYGTTWNFRVSTCDLRLAIRWLRRDAARKGKEHIIAHTQGLSMDKSNSVSNQAEETRDGSVSSEASSQGQASRSVIRLWGVLYILTVALFISWIVAGAVIKSDWADLIGPFFLVAFFLSAVTSRTISFYGGRTSRLGFATEMVFMAGVTFVFLGFILDTGAMLPLFLLLSFIVSPLLGIVNRAIQLKRKEIENVRFTIAEMVVLAVPVIVVAWVLLYGLD
jgi:hypothetical protein